MYVLPVASSNEMAVIFGKPLTGSPIAPEHISAAAITSSLGCGSCTKIQAVIFALLPQKFRPSIWQQSLQHHTSFSPSELLYSVLIQLQWSCVLITSGTQDFFQWNRKAIGHTLVYECHYGTVCRICWDGSDDIVGIGRKAIDLPLKVSNQLYLYEWRLFVGSCKDAKQALIIQPENDKHLRNVQHCWWIISMQ